MKTHANKLSVAEYRAERAALDDEYRTKRDALLTTYLNVLATLDDDDRYEADRDALYDDYESERAVLVTAYAAKLRALNAKHADGRSV